MSRLLEMTGHIQELEVVLANYIVFQPLPASRNGRFIIPDNEDDPVFSELTKGQVL